MCVAVGATLVPLRRKPPAVSLGMAAPDGGFARGAVPRLRGPHARAALTRGAHASRSAGMIRKPYCRIIWRRRVLRNAASATAVTTEVSTA